MLAKRAAKLEKSAKTAGFGLIPWMDIFPMILNLIQSCVRPPTPAPPNPTPNPTPAQTEAWETAWHLKSTATSEWQGTGDDFRGPAFNRTARETKRQSRRDGTKISKKDADGATALAFSEARKATMVDLYNDVVEAKHAL